MESVLGTIIETVYEDGTFTDELAFTVEEQDRKVEVIIRGDQHTIREIVKNLIHLRPKKWQRNFVMKWIEGDKVITKNQLNGLQLKMIIQ
ncbi:hypothetical protein HYY71_06125 [Candidatus Woesearchaeota archaeon]|nr:hypothetical protein [Candidatus Woesearchaeota archaeon]